MTYAQTLAVVTVIALGLGGCSDVTMSGASMAGPPFCLFPPPARTLPQTTLRQTGRVLDLAIQGNGYFILSNPAGGRNRYTRFGQFRLTPEGTLTAPDYRYVLTPQLTVPTDAVEVQITSDGFLKVRQPDNPNNLNAPKGLQPVGQLNLAQFEHPEYLQTVQPTILEESCASGTALIGPPGQQALGTLLVGTLEVEASASDTGTTPH